MDRCLVCLEPITSVLYRTKVAYSHICFIYSDQSWRYIEYELKDFDTYDNFFVFLHWYFNEPLYKQVVLEVYKNAL